MDDFDTYDFDYELDTLPAHPDDHWERFLPEDDQ